METGMHQGGPDAEYNSAGENQNGTHLFCSNRGKLCTLHTRPSAVESKGAGNFPIRAHFPLSGLRGYRSRFASEVSGYGNLVQCAQKNHSANRLTLVYVHQGRWRNYIGSLCRFKPRIEGACVNRLTKMMVGIPGESIKPCAAYENWTVWRSFHGSLPSVLLTPLERARCSGIPVFFFVLPVWPLAWVSRRYGSEGTRAGVRHHIAVGHKPK